MLGTAVFTAIVLAYCTLILATAHIILPAIYRKSEIVASSFLLWPLALAIVCEATRIASSMSLLAMRRTRIVFLGAPCFARGVRGRGDCLCLLHGVRRNSVGQCPRNMQQAQPWSSPPRWAPCQGAKRRPNAAIRGECAAMSQPRFATVRRAL